jgi:hypothetical protein
MKNKKLPLLRQFFYGVSSILRKDPAIVAPCLKVKVMSI